MQTKWPTGGGRGGRNNFDALRVIAALAVVISHAFLLSTGTYAREPIAAISGGQTTAGGIAVLMFFVLSGFLITRSFDRSRDARRFVASRLLRIMPGLVVVVLLAAAVVGPLATILSVREYLDAPETYRYVAGNLSFLRPVDTLPGVFLANPFPSAVNGSLWTLRFEAACYALVLVLGLCRVLNRGVVTALFALDLAALATIGHAHSGIEFTSDFLAGAALYFWQPRLRPGVALACAALCGFSLAAGSFRFVSATAGAYLVLYLAMAPEVRLPNLTRYGDFSYGIYIYAFPVEQIVAASLGAATTWQAELAISLPFILALAALSWHGIEKRALGWRMAAAAPLPAGAD